MTEKRCQEICDQLKQLGRRYNPDTGEFESTSPERKKHASLEWHIVLNELKGVTENELREFIVCQYLE